MTPEQIVLRGNRAKRYLEDSFWAAMLHDLEQKHVEGLIDGKTPEIREGHRHAIFALREVVEELSAYVGDAHKVANTE